MITVLEEILDLMYDAGVDNVDIDHFLDNEKNIAYVYIVEDYPHRIAYLTTDKYKRGMKEHLILPLIKKRYGVLCKPGKLLLKLLPNYDPGIVREFSSLWGTIYDSKDKKFIITTTEHDFLAYYHYSSYACSGGTLGNSCMRGDEQQEYMSFYHNFCNVNLLVLLDKSKQVLGRAILWKNVKIGGVVYPYFMDRVYVCKDSYFSSFFKYAKENGFIYKAEQNYHNGIEFINPNGSYITDRNVSVPYSASLYDVPYFPFIDTFKYASSDGYLHNSSKKLKNNTDLKSWSCMENTCGERTIYLICQKCSRDLAFNTYGELHDSEEALFRSIENRIFRIDSKTYCSDCAVYLEKYGKNFLKDDILHLSFYNETIPKKYLVFCPHLKEYRLRESCVQEEGLGNWLFIPDCIFTEDTYEWILEKAAFKIGKNKWVKVNPNPNSTPVENTPEVTIEEPPTKKGVRIKELNVLKNGFTRPAFLRFLDSVPVTVTVTDMSPSLHDAIHDAIHDPTFIDGNPIIQQEINQINFNEDNLPCPEEQVN